MISMFVSFKQLRADVESRYLEIKSCGANKPGGGGFTAGNTCARGGKGTEVSSIDADSTTLYHGTVETVGNKVAAEGLKAKAGDPLPAIYATNKREDAIWYAKDVAKGNGEKRIAIIHLNNKDGVFKKSRLTKSQYRADVNSIDPSLVKKIEYIDLD